MRMCVYMCARVRGHACVCVHVPACVLNLLGPQIGKCSRSCIQELKGLVKTWLCFSLFLSFPTLSSSIFSVTSFSIPVERNLLNILNSFSE
jgi:hypothetical protein